MRSAKNLVVLGLTVMLAAGMAGCGKKAPVTPVPSPEEQAAAARARLEDSLRAAKERADALAKAKADSIAAAEAAAKAAAMAAAQALVLNDINFDYDKSNLTDTAQGIMSQNAASLSKHTDAHIVIEGHCDERGTVEYNLALGERRAAAAKGYLTNYGIDASHLETISYGKERPLDPGHNEGAWAKNRRAHFLVK